MNAGTRILLIDGPAGPIDVALDVPPGTTAGVAKGNTGGAAGTGLDAEPVLLAVVDRGGTDAGAHVGRGLAPGALRPLR